MTAFADFPALGVGYTFSRACDGLHIFPCLRRVTHFPVLATGYTFSRACDGLHIFPCLRRVTHFPALATGYTFSRACDGLHIFPCLRRVTHFSPRGVALGNEFRCMYGPGMLVTSGLALVLQKPLADNVSSSKRAI